MHINKAASVWIGFKRWPWEQRKSLLGRRFIFSGCTERVWNRHWICLPGLLKKHRNSDKLLCCSALSPCWLSSRGALFGVAVVDQPLGTVFLWTDRTTWLNKSWIVISIWRFGCGRLNELLVISDERCGLVDNSFTRSVASSPRRNLFAIWLDALSQIILRFYALKLIYRVGARSRSAVNCLKSLYFERFSTELLISSYKPNRDCIHLAGLYFTLFCLKDKPLKSKFLLMWCRAEFFCDWSRWLVFPPCAWKTSAILATSFSSDPPISTGFGIVMRFFAGVKLLPSSRCLICSFSAISTRGFSAQHECSE